MPNDDIQVVTNENYQEFVEKKLAPDPEVAAAIELEKVEAEKAENLEKEAAKDDPTHDLTEVPKSKKEKLNERFKELTDKRKDAEARAEKAAAEAKTEREAREALARERDELKSKYEPVRTEPIAKPELSQFKDVAEYEKAIEHYTADKVRREDAAKVETEKRTKEAAETAKAWNKRLAETKAEMPDYDEVVGGSEVKVSDQVRDAIVESEIGPKILYHLAKSPDVADKISEMTVGRALKEIGKLEVQLAKQTEKTPIAEVTAQISKAPAPITPLRGGNAPVGILKGSDDVPKHWDYDTWKKHYEAGKIQ